MAAAPWFQTSASTESEIPTGKTLIKGIVGRNYHIRIVLNMKPGSCLNTKSFHLPCYCFTGSLFLCCEHSSEQNCTMLKYSSYLGLSVIQVHSLKWLPVRSPLYINKYTESIQYKTGGTGKSCSQLFLWMLEVNEIKQTFTEIISSRGFRNSLLTVVIHFPNPVIGIEQ